MNTLPIELLYIIKEYTIYKPKSYQELMYAVDEWYENKTYAIKKYGHISTWNTVLITDMSDLFLNNK